MCHEGKAYRPVVVAIIQDNLGSTLLVQSAKNPTYWGFPQGGINEGEDILEALQREVVEETGISLYNAIAVQVCTFEPLDIEGRNREEFSKGKMYYYILVKLFESRPKVTLKLDEQSDCKWVEADMVKSTLEGVSEPKRSSMLSAFAEV